MAEKIEVKLYYEDRPLQEGKLMLSRDAWLEPEDFEIVSDRINPFTDEGELTVSIPKPPENPCRFLGWSDGMPPACYADQSESFMEGCIPGAAHELVCYHCDSYIGLREERNHPSRNPMATRLDSHGVLELLPELTAEEAGGHGHPHVNRIIGGIFAGGDRSALTLAKAKEDFGIPYDTLVSAARQGRIPGTRQEGKIWLVTRTAIEEAIEAGRMRRPKTE